MPHGGCRSTVGDYRGPARWPSAGLRPPVCGQWVKAFGPPCRGVVFDSAHVSPAQVSLAHVSTTHVSPSHVGGAQVSTRSDWRP